MTIENSILAYVKANENCNLRQLTNWIIGTENDNQTSLNAIYALSASNIIVVSFNPITGDSFVSTNEGV